MKYIDFQFQRDEMGNPIIPEWRVLLKQRRMELGLTQTQVSKAAGITKQQYQRLESGERRLENASMRIGKPVCFVLQINSDTLFPDAEDMNSFADRIKGRGYMSEEDILEIAASMFERFNEQFCTNYTMENVKLAFCTVLTANKTYEAFTKKYGFYSERKKSFQSFGAEVFIGRTDCDDPGHVDGILVRTDVPPEINNARSYMCLFAREIAQVFCATHEIPTAKTEGKRFYDLYCAGTPRNQAETVADGQMNAGYAIWRQLIPDIIANMVYAEPPLYLKEVKTEIDKLAQEVKVGVSAAKEAMYMILAKVMNSIEAKEANSWEMLKEGLREVDIPFAEVIHLVYDQLNTECAYRITPEFIQDLGTVFMVAQIKNTSQEDIMAFMGRYGR